MAFSDEQARQLADGDTGQYSAWKVEQRSGSEILMDAGQARSWLSVRPLAGAGASTTLLFGSAVVPMRPGGKFGLAFHALLGFHRLDGGRAGAVDAPGGHPAGGLPTKPRT